MNLKSFDKLVRRDFENGAVIDEIRKTFKDYEETLRLLLNCLIERGPVIHASDDSKKFWDKVEEFLERKLKNV